MRILMLRLLDDSMQFSSISLMPMLTSSPVSNARSAARFAPHDFARILRQ